MLSEGYKDETIIEEEPQKFESRITSINNTINEVCNKIDVLVNEEEFEKEQLITEAIENTNE